MLSMLISVCLKDSRRFSIETFRTMLISPVILKCKMKNFLFLFLLIVIGACGNKNKKLPPNILFVMMDDLGYGQFGVNNEHLDTSDFDPFFVKLVDSLQGYSHEQALEYSKQAIPTMTKLAKNGITFRKAFASSSLCAPSRLGVATGILQNRFGVYANEDGEVNGFPPGSLLVEKLQRAGYRTAHIGKWHIGRRNKQVLTDIFKRHNLPEKTNYHELAQRHPEIYDEAKHSGYYGSVVTEHHPLNNGFDYYYGYNTWASQFYNSTLVWENFEHAGLQKGYNTDVFTDKALAFIKEEASSDRPFFVQLNYHAVHDSLEPQAPDRYLDRFNSSSFDLNNFYAHIYGVDSNLKRIVDYLQSENLFDNTVIIFTSDNGAMAGARHKGHKVGSPLPGNAPFSGHKGNFFQGGVRVPMFIHWPSGIKQPYTSDHLVSTMDILPTAIDVAHEEVPQNIDGKSLLPFFNEPNHSEIHDHLVWAGMHATAWGFLIEKSSKDHHTERPFAPPAWVIMKDDYLLRFTGKAAPGIYYENITGKEPALELYNTKNDPAETSNLATENPEKVEELSKIYFDESKHWPAPIVWDRAKWEELLPSKMKRD